MADIIEFPKYYKVCPKCKSKNIRFVEQTVMSLKRIYKVNKDGMVLSNEFNTQKREADTSLPLYCCMDCEWQDFGANTWNIDKIIK